MAEACKTGTLGGYGTDVLNQEPPAPGHPFNEIDNIIVTPHVGSRTVESVGRQAMRATKNLVNFLEGAGGLHPGEQGLSDIRHRCVRPERGSRKGAKTRSTRD